MLEGRDDTLGTAVELSQEIMNEIVSEAGNSQILLLSVELLQLSIRYLYETNVKETFK